jgi:hypothetical protein
MARSPPSPVTIVTILTRATRQKQAIRLAILQQRRDVVGPPFSLLAPSWSCYAAADETLALRELLGCLDGALATRGFLILRPVIAAPPDEKEVVGSERMVIVLGVALAIYVGLGHILGAGVVAPGIVEGPVDRAGPQENPLLAGP